MRASLAVSCSGAALALCAAIVGCELVVDTSHLDTGSDAGTEAGGDGGRDAAADALGDGPVALDAACPGEAGPKMIRLGSYCIDTTEVTNADYLAFLSSDAGPSPPECAWKPNYDHDGGWTPFLSMTSPAGNVDWCDAFMYCHWAGKRLCGDPNGGSVPYDAWADPTRDAWYAACSGPDASAYPYGSTFDESKCNGLLADGGYPDGASTYTVEPVANRMTCQGGYAGIFDLSGNVAEWEDCCDPSTTDAAADQPCRNRGGSAHSDSQQLRCDAPQSFGSAYARRAYTDDLGFRCCSP